MNTLERIIEYGNRGHNGNGENNVTCSDGFKVSVIAGGVTYCAPRPVLCMCHYGNPDMTIPMPDCTAHDYPGPYAEVEVGFPSVQPEPWAEWREHAEDPDKPTETVYCYVPVQMVRDLIAAHGGEKS